jgi:hypothetical protein
MITESSGKGIPIVCNILIITIQVRERIVVTGIQVRAAPLVECICTCTEEIDIH